MAELWTTRLPGYYWQEQAGWVDATMVHCVLNLAVAGKVVVSRVLTFNLQLYPVTGPEQI